MRLCTHALLLIVLSAGPTAPAQSNPSTPATAPAAPVAPPASAPSAAPTSAPSAVRYRNYSDMVAILRQLAAGGDVTLRSLAKTAGGRDVWLAQAALDGPLAPDQRPAILLVGGVDADHPTGSAVCLLTLEHLLQRAAEMPGGPAATLLRDRTLLVVPRVNPDGLESFFEKTRHCERLNARPVDDDRDGVVNEDGPNDMNGDGVVSVMRYRDGAGDWIVDPDDARMLKRADPAKGQRGIYKIALEGIDLDDDGLMNEDGPGGVDSDRNWPHFFDPLAPGAGLHALSEPETRGLAEFVTSTPNIAAAIVFGRNDNIVRVPKGKDRGPEGQSYRDLHPNDVELYEALSVKFRESTGLEDSAGGNPSGALYAWLYSQQGLPTIATSVWWPLTRPKPQPTSAPDGAPASAPSSASSPSSRPVESKGRPPLKDAIAIFSPESRVESSETLKRWLEYADECGTPVEPWIAFQHPALGEVELGGLPPYLALAAPPDELAQLAAGQAKFIEYLSERLPRPALLEDSIQDLGGGVWQIELRLVNEGEMPTSIAAARHAELGGFAIRPQLPPERVLGGRMLERVPFLHAGADATLRWLVRGQPGDEIVFRTVHRVWGTSELRLALRARDGASK